MNILASFSFVFILSLCIFAQQDRSRLPQEMQDKLAVIKADKIEFKAILKEPKTVVGKLWNYPCKVEKVVNIQDTDCFRDFEVGLASTLVFSFGEERAYVYLAKGEFSVMNFGFNHSSMADLGEIPISQISQKSDEVKLLGTIPLTTNSRDGNIYPKSASTEHQGLIVKSQHPAKLNHTYLLHSTISRVKSILLGNNTTNINQRRETIYAFQVVKQEGDVLTIIWKPIKSKLRPFK